MRPCRAQWAMISMGRTLEKLGPKRQFTRVRGRGVLGSSYSAFCMDRAVVPPEDPFAPVLCVEINTTCVSPVWISALVNGMRRPTQRSKAPVGTSPHRFGRSSSVCRLSFTKEPATDNPRTYSMNFGDHLTLTRTQYCAIVGNAENTKPFVYAGFANPCNAQKPLTAHS
jgi:hypothetical protein